MKGKLLFINLLLFLILLSAGAVAQTDSLVMNNGNYLVGEMKEMKQGIIQLKTKYSDSDFKIKWENVKYLKTNQFYIVYLVKGVRYYGSLSSDPDHPGNIIVHDFQTGNTSVKKMDIIYLKEADKTFISRVSFDISLGYSLAKANSNSQFSTKLNAGYLANTFSTNISYSMNRTFQTVDDTIDSKTKRTEAGIGAKYFLGKSWFLSGSADLLNSSEQKLKFRATIKLGAGNFVVNNHVQSFSVSGGAVWNIENYYEETIQPGKNSLEAYAGLQYVIFNMGDLDINTSVYAYPSITEKGRFRSDFNFNLKYDFVADFFINLGFTYNFDNQPVAGAPKFDYVFETTIGWEL
jgi:putative salt-induced outer membrane protein YdiY